MPQTKKSPVLISVPSVSTVGVILFAVLSFVYGKLGNTVLAIIFLVCAIFFACLGIVFAIHLILILRYDNKEVQEATNSFVEQFNSFKAGHVRLLNNEYGNKALERLQNRINLLAGKLSEQDKEEGDETTLTEERFFNKEEFPDALHGFIKSSSSFSGALVAVDTIGAEEIPDNADEALLRSIRLIFSPSIITKNKNGSYTFYVDRIGDQGIFKSRCERFIRSYNVTEINKESSTVVFYSAKLGAALFPFNSETKLLSLTQSNLKKANPICISGNDGSAQLPYAGISERPKRALLLSANEIFLKDFLESKDENDVFNNIANALDYYCMSMDFSTGGILIYNGLAGTYSVFMERTIANQENHGLSLFAEKRTIPESYINPIFSNVGQNGFFFIDDVGLLPYEVSERLESLQAKTVILFPMSYGQNKIGMAYLISSKKKSGQDLMERESADSFFSLVSVIMVALKEQKDARQHLNVLDALAERGDKKLYTVDGTSYRLQSFSRSIEKAFPGIKKGDLCYKAIMGLDAPCEQCPLKDGSLKRNIAAFGPNEQIMTNLFTGKAKDGRYSTILIEGEEKMANFSNNLYDKNIGVFNCKAFSSEINKEIRTRGYGIALAFRVTNMDEILSRNKEESSDSILRAMASLIQDEGYGNILYRYDETSFVLLLKSMNKMGLTAIAEDIAYVFSKPLQISGNSIDLKLAYASITYPNEASANFEMISLIESELKRSTNIGIGYLCEVGRNRIRKAYRKAYILQLLQESVSHNNVETRLSAIMDTTTRKPAGIEFTLGLTGFANETISKKEFLPVAEEANILKDLDFKALTKVGNFYKNYYDTALKANGIKYFSLTVSAKTLLAPVFLNTIEKFSNDYGIPKNMMIIAVECSQIVGMEDEIAKVIASAKQYGVLFSAHSFDPNTASASKLHEIGFSYVRVSKNTLQSAMFSQSGNASFIRMAAEFDEQSLTPIVNHVVDNEQAQFCLDMAMPYYVDGTKAHALTETDFITYINFRK